MKMPQVLVDIFKEEMVKHLDELLSDDVKKEVVAKWNKSIDIPFINEKTEEKALNKLYDIVEKAIKSALVT